MPRFPLRVAKTAGDLADVAGSLQAGASWFERGWAALPEWTLTVSGVLFLLVPLALTLGDYRDWRELGPYYRFEDGQILHLPIVRILSDWTAVLVLLGFCVRMRPRQRNSRFGDVAIGLLGSTWLYAPFVVYAGCKLIDRVKGTQLGPGFLHYWMADSLSLARTLGGSALVTIGNVIDTWGYTVLLRSFSQTPEARELKVTGPYRIIRHPVYFGQMLTQLGIYFCFAARHAVWIGFWAAFCAIQLRRAWREEQVLEDAFGEKYLSWKRRTVWLW